MIENNYSTQMRLANRVIEDVIKQEKKGVFRALADCTCEEVICGWRVLEHARTFRIGKQVHVAVRHVIVVVATV